MNYYEDTIANNIHILITYPINDKIYLIIYEAYEQAIAFAKVLEFVEYKNLFYSRTFIIDISRVVVVHCTAQILVQVQYPY